MKIFLVLLLMSITISPANASDWIYATESSDGEIHYIDRSSLIVYPNKYIKYWKKVLYKKPMQRAKGKVWYSLFEEAEDCTVNKNYSAYQEIDYGLDGKVLYSIQNQFVEPATPAPDTVGDASHNLVCLCAVDPENNQCKTNEELFSKLIQIRSKYGEGEVDLSQISEEDRQQSINMALILNRRKAKIPSSK